MKKIAKKKKWLFSLIVILSLIIIILILLLINKLFLKKEIYILDSRIEAINEEKKKENDNYSVVSWLRVQGTNIDTPVIAFKNSEADDTMLSVDNYLWNEVEDEKLYNKVSIQGHNILNLSAHPGVGLKNYSRFDELMSFVYDDFASKNKYIQYTVDGKDYIYKIFAVGMYKKYEIDQEPDYNYDKDEIKEYVDFAKKRSIYDYDIDVDYDDKFISLMTCTKMFGAFENRQFVVDARMIRDNEKTTDYRVVKNKKYEEIEKILKGDELNEKSDA